MFVIEAARAIVPRMVLKLVACWPAMMIEPTTAIAEMAQKFGALVETWLALGAPKAA